MGPTLADVTAYTISIVLGEWTLRVKFSRLQEKAIRRVYCCLFSRQGPPSGLRPLNE